MPNFLNSEQVGIIERLAARSYHRLGVGRLLMALQRRLGRGKASRLCPCSSDVDLFGYGEGVIDLNAEIADCALESIARGQ